MNKKTSNGQTAPYYIRQLKSGLWTVFDRQQRMHGGTHAHKSAAETVLQHLLTEHQKGTAR